MLLELTGQNNASITGLTVKPSTAGCPAMPAVSFWTLAHRSHRLFALPTSAIKPAELAVPLRLTRSRSASGGRRRHRGRAIRRGLRHAELAVQREGGGHGRSGHRCLVKFGGRRVPVVVPVAVPMPVAVADRGGRGRRLDSRGSRGSWGGRTVGHWDRPGGVGGDLAVRPGGGGVHGHDRVEPERQAERPGGAVRGGVVDGREVVTPRRQPATRSGPTPERTTGWSRCSRPPAALRRSGRRWRSPPAELVRLVRSGWQQRPGRPPPIPGQRARRVFVSRSGPPHHRGLVPAERVHPFIRMKSDEHAAGVTPGQLGDTDRLRIMRRWCR
jgi:hypothetical protein